MFEDKNPIEYVIEEIFQEDSKVAVAIAKCESGLKQFDSTGKVLRGRVNSKDTGIFQVNETYHLKNSLKLGYDIHSVVGNIAYAKYLYDKNGLRDWLPSKDCWSK